MHGCRRAASEMHKYLLFLFHRLLLKWPLITCCRILHVVAPAERGNHSSGALRCKEQSRTAQSQARATKAKSTASQAIGQAQYHAELVRLSIEQATAAGSSAAVSHSCQGR